MSGNIKVLAFVLAYLAWINTSESLPSADIIDVENPDAMKNNDLATQIELMTENLDATNQKLKFLEEKISTEGSDSRSSSPVDDVGIDEHGLEEHIRRTRQRCNDPTIINQVIEEDLTKFLENFNKQTEDLTKKISNLENLLDKKLIPQEEDKTVTDLYDQHFDCLKKCTSPAKSCASAMSNRNVEGVYLLGITDNDPKPFYAHCVLQQANGSAWTVIHRRKTGSVNFNRNWSYYKRGFGDLNGEYWLGLERIHAMTTAKPHELWISLTDYSGKMVSAKYSKFSVGSEEEGYKLSVSGFSGNAGDSFSKHDKSKFSTYDKDNDMNYKNCARLYKGGWWYENCYWCNLNGNYHSSANQKMPNSLGGIKWNAWTRQNSLSNAHMAIRPVV